MKKVYYNANVITMEKDAMHAQAFVVEDGHFTAVGSNEEILGSVGAVEAEDMKGKTILPAFFETHMHNLSEGLILRDMNHNECTSIAGLIEYSRNFLATTTNLPSRRRERSQVVSVMNSSPYTASISVLYSWLSRISSSHRLASRRYCIFAL